ncbi:MAG: nitroreductase family protein [Candidatus Komeilibacteria bacterium]|nr:nitroreductase family protein [Candidatus Komeilibacteria bacterium]
MTYPNKPADVKYPINELAKNRWSPRVFADRPIEEEKIMLLFEAARWAPSSFNEQPWRYIYATKDDQEKFKQLFSLMGEFNQGWAGKAWLLAVSFVKKNQTKNGQPNYYAMHDTGAASFSLVLEAVNQGLMGHQMAGFDKERAVAELGFDPAEYQAGSMIAVGYPPTLADLEKLTPEQQTSELSDRKRKVLTEILFKGKFKAS